MFTMFCGLWIGKKTSNENLKNLSISMEFVNSDQYHKPPKISPKNHLQPHFLKHSSNFSYS